MKTKKQNKRLLKDASEVIQHLRDHLYLLDGKLKTIHIVLEEEDESNLHFALTMKEGKVQREYDTHESPYEMPDSSSPSDLLNWRFLN